MLSRSALISILLVSLLCVGAMACGDEAEPRSVGKEAVEGKETVEAANPATASVEVPVTPQSFSETEKEIQEIVLGMIEAMEKVESFHFEESYVQYPLYYKEQYAKKPFFRATGEFQHPDTTRKVAFFDYEGTYSGAEYPFDLDAEGFRYEVTYINPSIYLTQISRGGWGPYKFTVPVRPGNWGHGALYDPVLYGYDDDYLYMLRKNPVEFVKRLPSLMWRWERTLKSHQMSMNREMLDGVDMYYITSERVVDDLARRRTTRIEIWIGVQDMLIRELKREVDIKQGRCHSSEVFECPAIDIRPTSEIDRFVFSDFGQDIQVEVPTFASPATVPSPIGDIAIYEGASGTFSIQYPGDQYPTEDYPTHWKANVDRDVFLRRPGYFEWKDGSGGYLVMRPLYYDEVTVKQTMHYEWCAEDVANAYCGALQAFLEAMTDGGANIKDYVDYWEAWGWAPLGWGYLLPDSDFKILSQQSIEKAEGLAGEMFEISALQKDIRLALYLYRPDEPVQGCHPESEACHVLVIVAYGGNRDYLAELSDEIDYSFRSFQVHPAEESSPSP